MPDHPLPPPPNMPNQPLPSPSPTPPIPEAPASDKKPTRTIVITAVVIILLLGSLLFLLISKYNQQKLSRPTPTPEKPAESFADLLADIPVDLKDKDPQEVVSLFLDLIQQENQAISQNFIAENANSEAISATLQTDKDIRSLYRHRFTYEILETKIEEPDKLSRVDVQILRADFPSHHRFSLTKQDSIWQLQDHQLFEIKRKPYNQQIPF